MVSVASLTATSNGLLPTSTVAGAFPQPLVMCALHEAPSITETVWPPLRNCPALAVRSFTATACGPAPVATVGHPPLQLDAVAALHLVASMTDRVPSFPSRLPT